MEEAENADRVMVMNDGVIIDDNTPKEIFKKVAELNTILDKYDIDVKLNWEEYSAAYGQYFGMMLY